MDGIIRGSLATENLSSLDCFWLIALYKLRDVSRSTSLTKRLSIQVRQTVSKGFLVTTVFAARVLTLYMSRITLTKLRVVTHRLCNYLGMDAPHSRNIDELVYVLSSCDIAICYNLK